MCRRFLVQNIVVKLYVLLEKFAHRCPLFVHIVSRHELAAPFYRSLAPSLEIIVHSNALQRETQNSHQFRGVF